MRNKVLLVLCAGVLCVNLASAQIAKDASHMRPTGKGFPVEDANAPAEQKPINSAVIQGNGISYHGGPVMPNTVNIYYIWYGNWSGGAHASDSANTMTLLNSFMTGMSGSGYALINSTYGDNTNNVTGKMNLAASTSVNYPFGTRLSDSNIQQVVANAISSNALPADKNGLYFVLTSSDVTARSGFCNRYCGWHTHGSIAGLDIKYAFVGNPDRCPSSCEAQTNSPNHDSGADGMASVIAHETEEAISDPDLNAWYDSSGAENADKCAWKWGPTTGNVGSGGYNQSWGGHNWLVQMNWENARGGGCDKTKGGAFYTR